MMIVQVINESLNMLPAYETPQSAGMDVKCTEHIVMNPGERVLAKTGLYVEIPAGFETDLASIPRSFMGLIPVNGKHRNAAIVHDYLYVIKPDWCSRSLADSVFLEAMQVLGESRLRRAAMYAAVRVGGWVYWNRCSI